MRTKFIAGAAMLLAGTAFAAPAFAQSTDAPFTGPRAEAVVGWDHVKPSGNGTTGVDGAVYGGSIGYDFQAGSAVLGVEGEITGTTARRTDTDVLVAGDSARLSAGRDLYVGGRVGFTVGGNALIYAKGGYTNAKLNSRYTSGATDVRFDDNADGWRLGAGAEVKLNDKVYLKGEYRYSKYDNEDAGIDAKRHQVVGGVGVRF
jgi:outer membrane immunogenic protein